MKKLMTYVDKSKIKKTNEKVTGEFITIKGDEFYKISNYEKMDPFLVSLASSSDHWLYISSTGGLTAGRKNADNSLFPYETDDKLHDASEITGSKTIIRISDNDKVLLWEPFSQRFNLLYNSERNIYKNISGTKIIFEEINKDLQLVFRYGWTTSDKFGFVKFSEIENLSKEEITLDILDGIQNILPADVLSQLQQGFSTLVNGYKKNELVEETGLGIFSLSSIPSDRAQPSESLRATTIFSNGLEVKKYLLSSKQLENFRLGNEIETEKSIKGVKASYFINSDLTLNPNGSENWLIVAEVNQNSGKVIELNGKILAGNLKEEIEEDIELNKNNLINLVSQADGLQFTNNKKQTARHFSNVLFNIMRGGIFADSYNVEKDDFLSFIKKANPFVLKAHAGFIEKLPEEIKYDELIEKVLELQDSHFSKLALEYLPLMFSRRHGDPSRPWNQFSIEIKNDKNQRVLNYQGNWRDIFQNWEALSLSYPEFLKSMIAKFLNNTTADGYNPYRIFRDGFDWEDLEPHNPWANIGYWGDHQVIYLLKLLEWLYDFDRKTFYQLFEQQIFSFANVPYRIKSYEEISKNPRDTIDFDFELSSKLRKDSELYGSNTLYLKNKDNTLVQVSLTDKLLITLLVKLSNFVPGGGIWLNTQRPEWNDANNALVGFGLSMVTLYYLRRYLKFIEKIFAEYNEESIEMNEEVKLLFDKITEIFKEISLFKNGSLTSKKRKEIVDKLGMAGSEYRETIYNYGFNGKRKSINKNLLIDAIKLYNDIIEETIKANKREDGLYHSYNLLRISESEMGVENLYEMLEGQVAVLSSGYLSSCDVVSLLKSLKNSSLYRADQNSYILYPNKELKLFIEKNIVKKESVEKSALLKKLLEDGNIDIIYKDVNGNYHFQYDIINAEKLDKKLDQVSELEKYSSLVPSERNLVQEIYEDTFEHKNFTGRANTFYKYEGLGSIYWHMVSKLLLAVYENFRLAESKNEINDAKRLKEFYFDIKEGIGAEKNPDKYGAFTTDPYSHTPSFCGVQQPGMTGQVKEDVISRMGELGISISDSKIVIKPSLLNKDEFLTESSKFYYYDVNGNKDFVNLDSKTLGFTYCQVPFVYKLSDSKMTVVTFADGTNKKIKGLTINEEVTKNIFLRNGKVKKVEIFFAQDDIL